MVFCLSVSSAFLTRVGLRSTSSGLKNAIRPFSSFHLPSSPQHQDGGPLKTSTSESLPPVDPEAHRVVFLRHGESEFNNANVFTGWCDVALTQRGVVESVEAGQVFASLDVKFRKCYCSVLTRSIVTAQRCLEAAGLSYTPLQYDWRLNERMYGALQGLSKEQTAERLGQDLVRQWRRSYEARPPAMLPHHPHYEMIQNDPRYQHIEEIPVAESLQDCQQRVVVAWNDILNDMQTEHKRQQKQSTNKNQPNQYSLVVAHANTLRALVMHLDDIDSADIEDLFIPTAIPFYYDISIKTGKVLAQRPVDQEQSQKASVISDRIGSRFRGLYMSDKRKKRGFWERRRAANDPWLWALHPDQVSNSMLLQENNAHLVSGIFDGQVSAELEQEAEKNTKLFSPHLRQPKQNVTNMTL